MCVGTRGCTCICTPDARLPSGTAPILIRTPDPGRGEKSSGRVSNGPPAVRRVGEKATGHEETAMRFMVITKATADSEAGRPATTEEIATMGGFIEEMMDTGVLLAAEGILPSAKGARIYFDGG